MMKYITKFAKYVSALKHKQKRGVFENILHLLYRMYKGVQSYLRSTEDPLVARAIIRASRSVSWRGISSGKWSYVSMEELAALTMEWAKTLPREYDVIVGVPRSGLLVASMIAGKLGKPLSTPDQFPEVVWKSKQISTGPILNILLVDDSISTGNSMREAKEKLALAVRGKDISITTAALIVSPGSEDAVDLFHVVVKPPRLFEWNLLHAHKGSIAVDLDGVLCEEVPEGIEEYEEQYLAWMHNARPYLVPAFPVDAIITNRLEKYRAETEAWLRKHRIQYRQLLMWNAQSPDERRQGPKSRHKVSAILKMKPMMFWESGLKEGKEIFEQTGVPVYCVGENIVLS